MAEGQGAEDDCQAPGCGLRRDGGRQWAVDGLGSQDGAAGSHHRVGSGAHSQGQAVTCSQGLLACRW